MIDIHHEEPPEIPAEWVEVVSKLHPVTAVVVWAVLNNQVTPEIISLARFSPDTRRYDTIGIIAGGNPNAIEALTELAYQELFSIFADLIENPRSQLLH
jgi:Mg/Co/Ni transporter MgtE